MATRMVDWVMRRGLERPDTALYFPSNGESYTAIQVIIYKLWLFQKFIDRKKYKVFV